MLEVNGIESIEDNPAYQALMRFYEAEGRYSASGDPADRAALLDTLDPEIVLHQPESLPYGGIWRGRDGFGRWLDRFVETWAAVTPMDPQFFASGSERIIATVTLGATARATGIQIRMPMCQIIDFSGGRPTHWRNFAWDTAKMNEALGVVGTEDIDR